jgi:predicted transporter
MTNLKRQIRGISIGLVVEFILGVMLASVAAADETAKHQSTLHSVTLGLHMLIGLGLVIGSIVQAAMARQYPAVRAKLIAGSVAIIVAFAAGMSVVAFDSSWGVLIMGLGFIVALWQLNQAMRIDSDKPIETDKPSAAL